MATRIGLAQHDGQFRRCYFDRCYFEALQKIGAAARRCEVRCHFDRCYLEALQLERINIYFNEDARGRYASLAILIDLDNLQLKRVNVYFNEAAGGRYAPRAIFDRP